MKDQNSERVNALIHQLSERKTHIIHEIETFSESSYKGGLLYTILSHQYNLHDVYGKIECGDTNVSDFYNNISEINKLRLSLDKKYQKKDHDTFDKINKLCRSMISQFEPIINILQTKYASDAIRLIEINNINTNVIKILEGLTEYSQAGIRITEEIQGQGSPEAPEGALKEKINIIMENALHEAKSAGVDKPEIQIFFQMVFEKIKEDQDLKEMGEITPEFIETEVKDFYKKYDMR